jgi:hypothetical protein
MVDISAGEVFSNLNVSMLAAGGNRTERSPLKYAVAWFAYILRDCQASSLFGYLGHAASFKAASYYGDAPLHQARLCESISAALQVIEARDILGEIDLGRIGTIPTPVSGLQFAWRVECEVSNYAAQIRAWLAEGADCQSLHMGPLVAIVKLVVLGFLTLTSGEVAPFDALWDAFEAAKNSECMHDSFKMFQRICADKEIASPLTRGPRKAVLVLYYSLAQGIFPFLPLYLIDLDPPKRWQAQPKYWNLERGFLELSAALLPLRNTGLAVDAAAFRKEFQEEEGLNQLALAVLQRTGLDGYVAGLVEKKR